MDRKRIMIEAHKKLINQYRKGLWTAYQKDCPLCMKTTPDKDSFNCMKCTQGDIGFRNIGETRGHCRHMRTYPLGLEIEPFFKEAKRRLIRIEYHERAIKILEQLPNYRFELDCEELELTPFPELWELDGEIAEKYGNHKIATGVYVYVGGTVDGS